MKCMIGILSAAALALLAAGCDDEKAVFPSDDLGMERFGPLPGDDPRVHTIYEQYGVWIRMDMKDGQEIYNSFLATDNGANMYDAIPIDDQDRNGALIYAQTFFSHISPEFTNAFFPLEWWFAQSYGGSFWKYDYRLLGRNRFILCWPNQMEDALPVKDIEHHFCQDSVLAYEVWRNFALASAQHMPEGLRAFSNAGKSYDNGEAVSALRDQYYESDRDRYYQLVDELCASGGFVNSGGASNFNSDFSGWITLLAMESYENIKARYLDNSEARRAKYEILVQWLGTYNWDIQAAGDTYRRNYDRYLASRPD
ncbi:MAG: hypothetical protein LUD68_05150 [Rikenellaceae bacterium]|nr:hypothetical protein [Rikenellaceae bacterium]